MARIPCRFWWLMAQSAHCSEPAHSCVGPNSPCDSGHHRASIVGPTGSDQHGINGMAGVHGGSAGTGRAHVECSPTPRWSKGTPGRARRQLAKRMHQPMVELVQAERSRSRIPPSRGDTSMTASLTGGPVPIPSANQSPVPRLIPTETGSTTGRGKLRGGRDNYSDACGWAQPLAPFAMCCTTFDQGTCWKSLPTGTTSPNSLATFLGLGRRRLVSSCVAARTFAGPTCSTIHCASSRSADRSSLNLRETRRSCVYSVSISRPLPPKKRKLFLFCETSVTFEQMLPRAAKPSVALRPSATGELWKRPLRGSLPPPMKCAKSRWTGSSSVGGNKQAQRRKRWSDTAFKHAVCDRQTIDCQEGVWQPSSCRPTHWRVRSATRKRAH